MAAAYARTMRKRTASPLSARLNSGVRPPGKSMAIVMTFMIVFAALLALIAYSKATRFFSALLAVQPDALDQFQTGPGIRSYGPIAPDRFRYLNARKFESLQDLKLRNQGEQAYFALLAHALSFVALLVTALILTS